MKNLINKGLKIKHYQFRFTKSITIIVFALFYGLSVYSQDYYLNDLSTEIQKTNPKYSRNYFGLDAGMFPLSTIVLLHSALTYERFISENYKKTYSSSLRAGIGYLVVGGEGVMDYIQIPVSYIGILGKGDQHFEYNVGGIFALSREELRNGFKDGFKDGFKYSWYDTYLILPIVNIGYRFQKPTGGFMFRALIGMEGISIGIGLPLHVK